MQMILDILTLLSIILVPIFVVLISINAQSEMNNPEVDIAAKIGVKTITVNTIVFLGVAFCLCAFFAEYFSDSPISKTSVLRMIIPTVGFVLFVVFRIYWSITTRSIKLLSVLTKEKS